MKTPQQLREWRVKNSAKQAELNEKRQRIESEMLAWVRERARQDNKLHMGGGWTYVCPDGLPRTVAQALGWEYKLTKDQY